MAKRNWPQVGGNTRLDTGSYRFNEPIGTVFYVRSVNGVDSPNYGGSPENPFATINYAITQCTADNDDIILVCQDHSESISGAAAIAASKAGVQVRGLGTGKRRPLITLHTAGTTIAVSAARVRFSNLRITCDVDAVVSIFNITAAGCELDGVDVEETTSCAPLQFVLTSALADDLVIQNCRHIISGQAAASLQEWIKLVGADRAKILNNYIKLKGFATSNPANGVIVGGTTASLDVEIGNNTLITLNSTGAIPISLLAGTTGHVYGNRVASAKTAIAGSVACASCYASNNYANHVVNTSGALDPASDS